MRGLCVGLGRGLSGPLAFLCSLAPFDWSMVHQEAVAASEQEPQDLTGSLVLSLSEETAERVSVAAVVLLDQYCCSPALLELPLFVETAEAALDQNGCQRHPLIKCILQGYP